MLEGTSAGVEVGSVLNPSSCEKGVLTWGKFVTGFARADSRLEVVEIHGGMLVRHAVDSILYPVPTHDDPSQVPDRLEEHYRSAPGGMHEESGESL